MIPASWSWLLPVQHDVQRQRQPGRLHERRRGELPVVRLRAGQQVRALPRRTLCRQLDVRESPFDEVVEPGRGQAEPGGDEVDVAAETRSRAPRVPAGPGGPVVRRRTCAPAGRPARAPARAPRSSPPWTARRRATRVRAGWSNKDSAAGSGGSARPACRAAGSRPCDDPPFAQPRQHVEDVVRPDTGEALLQHGRDSPKPGARRRRVRAPRPRSCSAPGLPRGTAGRASPGRGRRTAARPGAAAGRTPR